MPETTNTRNTKRQDVEQPTVASIQAKFDKAMAEHEEAIRTLERLIEEL